MEHPIRAHLLAGRGVRIQVVRVNGTAYLRQAVEDGIARFASYMAEPPQREPDAVDEVEVNGDGHVTRASLESLIERRRCTEPCDITIFIGSALEAPQYRGQCMTRPNGSHAVVIYAPRLNRSKPPVLSLRLWWSIVVSHELFHALGLPADRGRRWCGPHCTNPGCILYARVDWRSVCRAIADFHATTDLCADCRREARQAGTEYDGDVLDELGEMGELIRLNPGVAWLCWRRAQMRCDRGDIASALEDQNRAVELDPDDGRSYAERAHIYLKLERYLDAGDDFAAALCLGSDEKASRNACNNLISLIDYLFTQPTVDAARALAITEQRAHTGDEDAEVAAWFDRAANAWGSPAGSID